MRQDGRSPQHSFGLDIVRVAAVLSVLFSHTADWWLGAGRATDVRAAIVGHMAGECFYSLSGFLIGGILLRAIERSPSRRLDVPALIRFWARRWLRTLPAYWAGVLALCWRFGIWDWRSLLFQQSWVPKTQWAPLTPHTWSLVLEEWFYLLVPLLVLAAGRLLRRRGLAVPAVCAALMLACACARAAAPLRPGEFWGPDPAINPLLRLDCASWGVLAAWAVQRWPQAVGWTGGAALVGVGTAMLAVLGAVSELSYAPESLLPFGNARWVGLWIVEHDAAMDLASACVVVGVDRLLPRGWSWAAAGVGGMARISYAVYLVHIPVLFLPRLGGIDDAAGWMPRLRIAALVLLAALPLRWGVEVPALRLRDRLAPDRPPARLPREGAFSLSGTSGAS